MTPKLTFHRSPRIVWILATVLVIALILPIANPSEASHRMWLREQNRHHIPHWTLNERRFVYHSYGFFSTTTDIFEQNRISSFGSLGMVL